jgi:hypothetical protein
MRQVAYELVFALIAIAAITAGYFLLLQAGVPQPNSVVGYSLGTAGFLLMLNTLIGYSIRKRWQGFHWGQMNTWLQLHVFTGLVGPYLVLLHSGWRFQGLAGVLMLATLVVTLSGVVARYIYTAVPRTLDGVEVATYELETRIEVMDQELAALGSPDLGRALVAAADVPERGWRLVLARPWLRWRTQQQARHAMQTLDPAHRAPADKMCQLLAQRQQLLMEMHSVEVTRRLLALWYLFHIPLTFALFTLAFVHIGAALYYAAFVQ